MEVGYLALPNDLYTLFKENGGIVTTAQANAIGISNERLRLLVQSNDLERVNFGVYILPDEFIDKMYITQIRRPQIIYSHETALYLHDMTDRDPLNYSITVPSGYNTTKLRAEGLKVYTIKRDLHRLGITELKTAFGQSVISYNLERTVCDCLRNRNQMDLSILTDAMKRYTKRKDKNLHSLMQYAEIFKVTKPLRSYLEVLL